MPTEAPHTQSLYIYQQQTGLHIIRSSSLSVSHRACLTDMLVRSGAPYEGCSPMVSKSLKEGLHVVSEMQGTDSIATTHAKPVRFRY